MIDYSDNIVPDAALRGQVPTLTVNELQLLTIYMADMMHGCNFHQILTSHVVVSSVNASLSGHVIVQNSTNSLYDPCQPVDDCPGPRKKDFAMDYTVESTHLLKHHTVL
jgi:hypothetical protein